MDSTTNATKEELQKLKENAEQYFKVKALGLGFEMYCPHCGSYGRHHVLNKDENGYGWQVLELECFNCSGLWEPWIDKSEPILGKVENPELLEATE